jgi:peptidoglycan/xylan/chitin deacetylase (PgdA/CDA1 family)
MQPLRMPSWVRPPAALVRRARGAARRWIRRRRPRSVILMYHRVAEVPCDPWDLCVSPQHFAEHLHVLRQTARVLPLEPLLDATRERKPLHRAAAITFDDGYADNLLAARPLLKEQELPATFFLATGALGRSQEFWWDELERLFLHPGTLPELLELQVNGEPRGWDLSGQAVYPVEAWSQHRHWRAQTPAVTIRQRVFYEVWQALRPLGPLEQEPLLEALAAWSGVARKARPTHRVMSWEEAQRLGAEALVDLGGHSVNHVALSQQPYRVQEQEIRSSRQAIETIGNRRARCFAYPYGDYSAETVEIVRDSGFTCAVTTDSGCVGAQHDPWRLPRMTVCDWDGETFARKLTALFESS